MSVRVIGERLVHELLTMQECIATARTAMILTARDQAIQPIRSVMRLPYGDNRLSMMPGYIEEPQSIGIKVIAAFPGNSSAGLSSHQGVICLFDAQTGTPVAVVSADAVTTIRTAAASAVATDALARQDARSVGIFGYGEQAASHVEAIPLVRTIDRVLVWGRDFGKASAFADREAAAHGLEVRAVASCEEVARECDILCTVTGAKDPFLKGDWLNHGVHVNVVGSSIPTTSEIDDVAVQRSRYFTDYVASARELSGDFRRALEAGAVGENHLLGCIGDVLLKRCDGRRFSKDITLFKSLGMSAEDLTAAHFVWRKAVDQDVGTVADF